MSWAEVKKINSDLTKPLDKLIIGNMAFVASEDITLVSFANNKANTSALGTFSPKIGGVVNFYCHFVNKGTTGKNGYIKINDGTSDVVSQSIGLTGKNDSSYYETVNVNLNVESGKTYTFSCTGTISSSDVRVDSSIKGMIINNAMYSYTVTT